MRSPTNERASLSLKPWLVDCKMQSIIGGLQNEVQSFIWDLKAKNRLINSQSGSFV